VYLPQFDSLRDAFITLISASLSNFDLNIFETERMNINKWYGYISMLLYLVISAIALLNFLIALISNVFNDLSNISIGLYRQSLIEIRQYLQEDKRYSSLVSSVPPLNLIPFLFMPFILWFQSPKLNRFILHFEYIDVMIIGVI